MVNWKRNLMIAGTGVFIAQAGFAIIAPFLPALVMEMGVRDNVGLWSGVVFAVNFLTASLMAPVWGSLSDRVGKRPMMIRAGLGIALTYVFMAYAHSVWELVAWRAINGLISGYIPAAMALVASNTPDSNLGHAMGALQGIAAAGLITGPLIGGVAAEVVGPRGTMILAAVAVAAAGLLPVVGGIQESVDGTGRTRGVSVGTQVLEDVRSVLRNRALQALFLVQMLFSGAQLFIQPILPLYVGKLVTERVSLVTGIVYSMVGVATAFGAPLASRFSSTAPLKTLRWGLLASAVFQASHTLVPSPVYLSAVRLALGVANACVSVAAGVITARTVEPHHRGRTFGVLQAVNGAGAVIGPFLGGLFGDLFGLEAPFLAGALVIVAAFWACPRTTSFRAPAAEQAPAR